MSIRTKLIWESPAERLRGDDGIAELCRKEGIAQSLYYIWSKAFMEAGERRLTGDTARAATSDEVKNLRLPDNHQDNDEAEDHKNEPDN